MLWKASKKVYSVLRSPPGERGLQKVSALYSYGKAVFANIGADGLRNTKECLPFI